MSSVTTFWKFVEGYEGIYQVSDQGQVRSVARIVDRSHGIPRRVRERLLVPGLTPKGYHAVSLYKGGRRVQRYVHQLVMDAFCGESANGREINHKDGDKSNNRRSNLEYATHADNMSHARECGLLLQHGEDNPRAKYTAEQIRAGYDLVAAGASYKVAAEKCGMSKDALEAACRGQNWKSLGLEPIRRMAC
jgi:hypothetical protein